MGRAMMGQTPRQPDGNPPLERDEDVVLAERAAALADLEPTSVEPETDVLSFLLDNRRFAVELLRVREVVRQPVLAVIPGAPDMFVGLLVLRGQPVVVADLRPLLGLVGRPMTPPAVVVIDGPPAPLGLAVDDMPRVEAIRARDMLPPPPDLAAPGSIVVALARGCTLLAADMLLAHPRLLFSSGHARSNGAAAPPPTRKEPA